MLTAEEISKAADDLFMAEQTRRQIGLLSLRHPGMTVDDAYAVQSALEGRSMQAGRRRIGWKVGLTSKAMQRALEIDIPDSGCLFDDMLFDNGARIPPARFIQPRIEAEIAFLMKRPVSGGATRGEVLAATARVAPSLEILDTRILRRDPATGVPRRVVDTISDNAANAGIVLGSERHRPESVDLRWVGVIVKRDGEVEETGLGAAVLDDPVNGVVWLANRLANSGQRIQAGDIVLTGSFIRVIEAPPGSRFHADFGPFGSVDLVFD